MNGMTESYLLLKKNAKNVNTDHNWIYLQIIYFYFIK